MGAVCQGQLCLLHHPAADVPQQGTHAVVHCRPSLCYSVNAAAIVALLHNVCTVALNHTAVTEYDFAASLHRHHRDGCQGLLRPRPAGAAACHGNGPFNSRHVQPGRRRVRSNDAKTRCQRDDCCQWHVFGLQHTREPIASHAQPAIVWIAQPSCWPRCGHGPALHVPKQRTDAS
ncbi:hypothetical protein BC831DRAFT_97618 [Entophlyctis helioformis]|nr:hypothetical protein BC831DRAFT_97618 [Entophlyctis helioformis]